MNSNATTVFAPFRIFLDPRWPAAERLARLHSLRAAGAEIVADQNTADFVVVCDSSIPTDQYSPDRAVLEASWVDKSLAAGRCLQEADNWGGCRVNLLERSATLPTPRISPVDATSSSSSWAIGGQPPFHLAQPHAIPHPMYPQPVPQFMPTMDPNHVYNMVLMDMMQQNGLMSYAPSQAMPNGAASGMGIPMAFAPQLPGLVPPPVLAMQSGPPLAQPQPTSIDVKGKGRAVEVGKIFTSSTGEPLTFYIALDVSKRATVISDVKRNGGKIAHQPTANYGVLASRGKDFVTLYNSVTCSHGLAVKPSFVADSISQGRLVDPTRYQFDAPEKQPRAKRTASKLASSSPEQGSAPNPDESTSAPVSKAAHQSQPPSEHEQSVDSEDRPSSPTPPPASTRILFSANKYRYPPVEDEYALRYAVVLYERDRLMSYGYLAKKLSEKLPHHSEAAWASRLSQTLRASVEDVRKRALIAHRKREHAEGKMRAESIAKRPRLSEAAGDEQSSASPAPARAPAPTEDVIARDVEIVARFFFEGADGDEKQENESDAERDARIWAQLAQRKRCTADANGWESFYSMHHEQVSAVYNALVAAAGEA
uniref:BRCT domain-containing protein n=1 Tax=Mycena chlorophos TaxID=658473 RepID=A0ABQ0L2W0_MYCCL|nr:predicted protein [Mycena chlorophos]